MREGGESTTDRIKGLDGTAGAESEFKSYYSIPFGFIFYGEDGLGCIQGTVFDEVGEFLSLGPWERGQRLRVAVGENQKKEKEVGKTHRNKISRAVFGRESLGSILWGRRCDSRVGWWNLRAVGLTIPRDRGWIFLFWFLPPQNEGGRQRRSGDRSTGLEPVGRSGGQRD